MTDVVIKCRNLDHSFGSGEARTQVLFGVDLEVRRGEFVVLKGASGSGKTTLLTLLACLHEIQSGSVELLNEQLSNASGGQLVALRRHLGFIFQAHNLHPALSAIQNVRMGLELHGRPVVRHWPEASAC